jgi:hypothetical protein
MNDAAEAPVIPDRAFYTGNSMRGMFVTGECLSLEPAAFDSLRVGDVIAIFDRTPYYVHRVVEIAPGRIVTMGDNNLRPDAAPVTPNSHFRRVVRAHELNGSVRDVLGGEAGMLRFHRQQRRRRLRACVSALLIPFKPLKFLRIPARTETRFRNGTRQWSCAGIPVAAQSPSGTFRYLHWPMRFFFRVPALLLSDSSAPGDQPDAPKEND